MTEEDEVRRQNLQPQFMHDCDVCRFLGRFDKADLYICSKSKKLGPSLIARFGDDESSFTSCRVPDIGETEPIDGFLREAFRRWKKLEEVEAAIERQNPTPKFQHGCDHCRFLGWATTKPDGRRFDLYACASDKAAGVTLHARHGDMPEDAHDARFVDIERGIEEHHALTRDWQFALQEACGRWRQREREAERQWVIPKDWKVCRNGNCVVELKPKSVKIEVHGRAIKTTCKTCGDIREGKLREYTEPRACKGCGYVRRVTVTLYMGSDEEHAENYCDACELERSATKHFNTAKAFMARAHAIRAARKGRK